MSDFERSFLHYVSFWNETFSTRQMLEQHFHTVLDFVGNYAIIKSLFNYIYSIKVTDVAVFLLFQKPKFDFKKKVSDFEWTILQRDKLWIGKFTTRQFFTWTLCAVSDFAHNFAFMKSRLFSFSTVKTAGWAVFVFFKRLQFEILHSIVSDTDIKNLQVLDLELKNTQHVRFRTNSPRTCQCLNWNVYNVPDSEIKVGQRVRFWIEIYTKCQILKDIFDKASGFEYDNSQRVWIWSEIFTTRQTLKWRFIQRVRF